MAFIGDAKRFRVELTECIDQGSEFRRLRFGGRVIRLDGTADHFAGGNPERPGFAVKRGSLFGRHQDHQAARREHPDDLPGSLCMQMSI
ncbi:MAG: hypothetical protein ACREFO_11550 [Acetobacteraceae bacterium]